MNKPLTLLHELRNRPPGLVDTDLASFLGVRTKALNQAAKRSVYAEAREPYRFKMTPSEWNQVKNTLLPKKHLSSLRFRPKGNLPYIYSFEGTCLVINRLRISLSKAQKETLLGTFGRKRFVIIDYGEGRPEDYLRTKIGSVLNGLVTIVPHHAVTTENKIYYIDLYLKEWNIAVEIDEVGHTYIKEEDEQRESSISRAIGCSFLRFSEDQDSYQVLNTLLRFVLDKLGVLNPPNSGKIG